jgi:hypothetical protein
MVLQEAKNMSERKGSFLGRKQDKKNFSAGSTRGKTGFGRWPLLSICMLLSTTVFLSVISYCEGDIQM